MSEELLQLLDLIFGDISVYEFILILIGILLPVNTKKSRSAFRKIFRN